MSDLLNRVALIDPDIADCVRAGYPRGYGWPYDEPDYENEEDYEDVDEE